MLTKGEATRKAILDRALGLASKVGLEGLTIGRLAEDLDLSKSGLFAHFQSKEALQVQVLDHAEKRFIDVVVKPALRAPRGEKRVRALFREWMSWPERSGMPGGCVFVHAAAELDDRPGLARDRLVALQREWLGTIARSARIAIEEGHFRRGVDVDQFAYEAHSIMLGYHYTSRLLRDPRAAERAESAFDSLVSKAKSR